MMVVSIMSKSAARNASQAGVRAMSTSVDAVKAATKTWMDTVTSGTPDAPQKTAGLYLPNALFWGTVSDTPRIQPEQVLSYFEFFARQNGLGVVQYDPNVRIYNDSVAVNAGSYTFALDKDGGKAKVAARYTFTYNLVDGKWGVIEHHSSAMPAMPEKLIALDAEWASKPEPPAPTPSIKSAKMSDEEVAKSAEEATRVWMNTVTSQTEDAPMKTAELYSDNALFWGTVSQTVRDSKNDTKGYFEFFARLPGLRVEEYSTTCRAYGHNMAMNLGHYMFAWEDPESGATKKVPARYSFLYQLAEDAGEDAASTTPWKIVMHHSSVMPEVPARLRELDAQIAA